MKTIARALLRWIVRHYPKPQLEIGQGMLTDLEELQGWEALEWALGGIQFYLELKGASMFKNIIGISSVVILAILASWLYTQHHLELSIGVLVLGVIVTALSQPKSAFLGALTLALVLPVTHLTQAYVFSSNMVYALSALNDMKTNHIQINLASSTFQWMPKDTGIIKIDSINSEPQFQLTGVIDTAKPNVSLNVNLQQLWDIQPNNWDDVSTLFQFQPLKLILFGLPITFLIAGLTVFLRSRFTKSPPLAM